jgi:hypothetical protein
MLGGDATLRLGCCSFSACPSGGQFGSCADGCGNGWYESVGQLFGPCPAGDQACLQVQAPGALAACK